MNECDQALLLAFADVRKCEQAIADAERELSVVTIMLKSRLIEAQNALEAAWGVVDNIVQETGEVEPTLPGEDGDYKLKKIKGKDSVDIADPNAVPEEFCTSKVTLTPNKPSIKKHLDKLRAQEAALPNWATIKKGEEKWDWRLVKKKHTV